MIDRALKVCQEFLESVEHRDIDISLETPDTLTQEDWTEFIDNYYCVVQWVQCACVCVCLCVQEIEIGNWQTIQLFGVLLQFLPLCSFLSGETQIESSSHLVTCCKAMLQQLAAVSPQLDIDGTHNIWIIKPGAKSRGRGESSDTIRHNVWQTPSWPVSSAF